jgi:hypothetical protein
LPIDEELLGNKKHKTQKITEVGAELKINHLFLNPESQPSALGTKPNMNVVVLHVSNFRPHQPLIQDFQFPLGPE